MTVDVSQFGKVAVLMGGQSAEREISLLSGGAVLTALQNKGVDVHAIDVGPDIVDRLREGGFDRVFIMLHGRGGEDGTMQGLLEMLNLPYTGSGVMASSIAMDKLKTKLIWKGLGLPTPDFRIISSESDCERALSELGLPLIVKPVLEGSSVGMTKVERPDELMPAWQEAERCGGAVIAESWVHGREYTAVILDDEVLPMIELRTTHKFYDFDAKYKADDTQYICPCDLSEDRLRVLADLVKQAFDAVDASAWGRVDYMIDEDDQAWLIEVNTVPGMTTHSLVPMAARQAGISFDDLAVKILGMADCEACG